MATPTYQGPGQPPLDNGGSLLGRIGSVFGGETPTYLGDGQPSSNVGALGRVTPAYAPAPTMAPTAPFAQQVDPSLACVETHASCPVDPAALAAGHIAIVIPRPACGTERDDVAATD